MRQQLASGAYSAWRLSADPLFLIWQAGACPASTPSTRSRRFDEQAMWTWKPSGRAWAGPRASQRVRGPPGRRPRPSRQFSSDSEARGGYKSSRSHGRPSSLARCLPVVPEPTPSWVPKTSSRRHIVRRAPMRPSLAPWIEPAPRGHWRGALDSACASTRPAELSGHSHESRREERAFSHQGQTVATGLMGSPFSGITEDRGAAWHGSGGRRGSGRGGGQRE